MMSVPGTEDQKLQLINCVSCHTVERIMKSSHDADEFVQVIARMNGYAQVSQPIKPQRRVDQSRAANPERFRKTAEWLATVNLNNAPRWEYELKTLPRVKGRGTQVIITEYDLPRATIEPHDVIVSNGSVWYSNFGEQFLGRLDPKTGKHTEYAMQVFKPGFPTGNLDVGTDKDGNIWLGMMYQGAIAKFDPKTEQFQYFRPSPERNRDNLQLNMVTTNYHVDGKVWVNDAGTSNILRLDLATGKFEEFDPLKALPAGKAGHSIYDVRADSQNNVYLTEYQKNNLARIDAKTGKFTFYQVPTSFSRNRRGRLDDQDRFWFAAVPRQQDHDVRHQGGDVQGVRRCRRSSPTPTTWSSTRTAMRGPAACRPTGWCGSIRRPARRSNIRCRATPTCGACSWTIPRTRRPSGSATTTAPRS